MTAILTPISVTTSLPSSDVPNPEAALARDFVNQTDRHLFLTGRAGTGKTTFLHRLREESPKQLAVVAPTGVAAINAKGVTIHSLFQLPFGLLSPERLRTEMSQRRFSRDKVRLLRGLDLLVIDEISMVRADVLDGIDYVLQRYRQSRRPFGGVQLLMIGDLHQLPPVVKQNEIEELSQYYRTPFFFGAKALQRAGLVTVELKHIYRQSDRIFIDLLNKVRRNEMDADVLAELNARHRQGYRPPARDGTITLTSHRHTADRTNTDRLALLTTKAHDFKAEVKGKFPESMYPTDEKLTLKLGAQVMFIKNDTQDKRYYNGKIGEVVAIDKKCVTVRCPDGSEVETGPVEWANQKFQLDEATKEVKDTTIGTFTQLPLRLAWAVTIHKSQGLTFDKVVIDAAAAFAHGQVYVALSRCRTLEGIVLSSCLALDSVRTDEVVDRYTQKAREAAPDAAALAAAKAEYRQSLIRALFDFGALKRALDQLQRFAYEKESALVGKPGKAMEELMGKAQAQLFGVAQKFVQPLHTYLQTLDYDTPEITLDGRPRKAIDYFGLHLATDVRDAVEGIDWRTDNQGVQGQLEERMAALQTLIRVKYALLKLAQNPFTDKDYLRTRTKAELGNAPKSFNAQYQSRRAVARKQHPHPKCLDKLEKWRSTLAVQEEKPPHRVIATRVMDAIAAALPLTTRQLLAVEGIGTQKTAQYGDAILEVIRQYCEAHQITAAQRGKQLAKPARRKTSSADQSIQLYNTGKSVADIARERGLALESVYNHLGQAVARGTLSIREFISRADQEAIEALLEAAPLTVALSEIKAQAEDRYAYHQLRMVREQWLRKQPTDQ